MGVTGLVVTMKMPFSQDILFLNRLFERLASLPLSGSVDL
jgi:hypothetical protein